MHFLPLPMTLTLCGFWTIASAQNPEITAYGKVVPGEAIMTIAMPYYQSAPQVVESLDVDEGEQKEKNSRLAVSNNHSLAHAELAEARARLQAKTERLKLVREGPKQEEIAAQQALADSLEVEAKDAHRRYERLRELSTSNAAAAQERDEAFARAQSLDLKQTMNKATLAAMRTVRPAEIAEAEAEVLEAEASVKRAEALLKTTEVTAPFKGRVLKVITYPGELASDKGVLLFGDTDAMQIKAEVNVSDVAKVKPGAKARATSEAWAGSITGTVKRIAPHVERSFLAPPSTFSNVDRRIVEVTITPDQPDKLAGSSGVETIVYIVPTAP